MGNYREQYLSALTKKVSEIVNKPEMTQQDIQFLIMYKRELARAEYVPTLKRIMNGAKEVFAFFRELNPNEEEADNKEYIGDNSEDDSE